MTFIHKQPIDPGMVKVGHADPPHPCMSGLDLGLIAFLSAFLILHVALTAAALMGVIPPIHQCLELLTLESLDRIWVHGN